MVALSG